MEGNASCREIAPTSGISRAPKIQALAALFLVCIGCRPSALEPVTLRYTYSWNEDRPEVRALLQQFTNETGVRVKNIPIPQATREYLDLARKLLADDSGADLLNMDLIWSATLEPDLIDLKPHLAAEVAEIEPELLTSYTVNGKLVAAPFNVPLGGLEYRTDLLRDYGYDHPPRTWDELESMAARIQAGERAKGVNDFWGYVWQGADSEALICNALEWQASAGGGRIIEADRTISVNNQATIGAWQRAKRWIGWISPPSVVAYREADSMLLFDSGKAAFNRIWLLTPMTRSGQARQTGRRSRPPVAPTGFARMPAGSAGSVGTLGGTGTAVSAHTTHRNEAIALLRYQLRALMNTGDDEATTGGAKKTEFSAAPSVSGQQNSPSGGQQRAHIVARPSIPAGNKYKQLSKAYIEGVHSILTGERQAPQVAADLDRQFVEITGFRAGPPR
jgi:trehalose/maltose transport system substrate-binding protein